MIHILLISYDQGCSCGISVLVSCANPCAEMLFTHSLQKLSPAQVPQSRFSLVSVSWAVRVRSLWWSCHYSQLAYTVDKAYLLTVHVRPVPREQHGLLAASTVEYKSVAVVFMLMLHIISLILCHRTFLNVGSNMDRLKGCGVSVILKLLLCFFRQPLFHLIYYTFLSEFKNSM